MEILFVWIDEYKNLKNLSMNFGSNYAFSFDEKILAIHNNELYVDEFYKIPGHSPKDSLIVKNITGIVGENGTGKSTILDFLLHLNCDKSFSDSSYLIVYEHNSKLYYEYSVINSPDKILKVSNYTDVKLRSKRFYSIKKSVLFFSNIFDARAAKVEDFDGYDNLINLSTNYLSSNSNAESNLRFLNEEFTRQIYFVKKFIESLDIKDFVNIPENITIEVQKFDMEGFNHYFAEAISIFEEEGIPTLLDEYKTNIFKYNFHNALIHSTLIDISDYITGIDSKLYEHFTDAVINFSYHISENNQYQKFDSHYLEDLLDHIDEEMKTHTKTGIFKKYISQLNERIQLRIMLLKSLDNMEVVSVGDYTVRIRTESDTLTDFLEIYNKLSIRYAFLDFTWSELSSGEYAYLSLFGRLYSAKESDKLAEEVIFLIDEGDLYYHPQWQKEWLYYFLRGINKIFSEMKIQVVLTTHSPFVLSDLPRYNVIFLEKTSNNLTKISDGLEGSQVTFAANIHSLLTNSFFITGGLIGLFAKEKINFLIHELLTYSTQHIKDNKNRIKNQIDIIGEPVVKKKLLSMLEEKAKLEVLDIDEKIIKLQKQINHLKGIRTDDES